MSAVSSRIFKNGNSQAVRIPQEFRLSVGRVEVSRTASGDLLIHPVPERRGAALLAALNAFEGEARDAFVEAVIAARSQPELTQEREEL
jgi:antitoxin VapB